MGQGDGSLGGVPDLRREEYKEHGDPVPTAARTRNTDRPAYSEGKEDVGGRLKERREAVGCTSQQPQLVGPPFFCFGKLKIGNCWRELIFHLVYYYSNLSKHNIWQVIFIKLLEMLLALL